jgi:molecular chaperone GrpE
VSRDERSDSRGAPEGPARPVAPREGDEAGPGTGTAASGGAADAAEPVGDQDLAVEAERMAETDRVRDLDAASTEDARGAGPGDGPDGPQGDGAAGGESADAAAAGQDPLARAEAQRDEYLALAQRAQADFDNYRKRAARDVAAAGARAKAELARAMLPVVDNLERALDSAGEGEAALAEGVRLVHSELVAALERNGVAGIEAAGEPFDPNVHEALSTRPDNGAEPGVVLDVVQKGYRLDGTVLRPARVIVAA